jgi:hypothetical protein
MGEGASRRLEGGEAVAFRLRAWAAVSAWSVWGPCSGNRPTSWSFRPTPITPPGPRRRLASIHRGRHQAGRPWRRQAALLEGGAALWWRPHNPGLDVCDIRSAGARRHGQGVLVAVDNNDGDELSPATARRSAPTTTVCVRYQRRSRDTSDIRAWSRQRNDRPHFVRSGALTHLGGLSTGGIPGPIGGSGTRSARSTTLALQNPSASAVRAPRGSPPWLFASDPGGKRQCHYPGLPCSRSIPGMPIGEGADARVRKRW